MSSEPETPHSIAPPLGATPKRLWIEDRFWELADACNRYMAVSKEIPQEWIAEMRTHLFPSRGGIPEPVFEQWRKWLEKQ